MRDEAFLGHVTEGQELTRGFEGVVCSGRIGQVKVVTKKLHHDPDNEELFKELYTGLLVPASPRMGVALTEDETPRLFSAQLHETALAFLRCGDATFARRKQLGIGLLLAVEGLAGLGLVHCDLKPDNFMMDGEAVYLIDFGSVRQEGDIPPMSCQLYCPPDSVVTLARDIFNLGKILLEVLGATFPEMEALHAQMCCGVKPSDPGKARTGEGTPVRMAQDGPGLVPLTTDFWDLAPMKVPQLGDWGSLPGDTWARWAARTPALRSPAPALGIKVSRRLLQLVKRNEAAPFPSRWANARVDSLETQAMIAKGLERCEDANTELAL
eukprot:s3018_g3.t1